MVGVRMQPEQLGRIDDWIERHPEPKPSRPQAIRKLVDEALDRS